MWRLQRRQACEQRRAARAAGASGRSAGGRARSGTGACATVAWAALHTHLLRNRHAQHIACKLERRAQVVDAVRALEDLHNGLVPGDFQHLACDWESAGTGGERAGRREVAGPAEKSAARVAWRLKFSLSTHQCGARRRRASAQQSRRISVAATARSLKGHVRVKSNRNWRQRHDQRRGETRRRKSSTVMIAA